jgi:hypothetical protein
LRLHRKARHIGDVVHHPHGQGHDPLQLRHIERGIGLERAANQLCEIDRAEQACTIGRQRLLTTVMDNEAVCIECVRTRYLNVEHLVFTDGFESAKRAQHLRPIGRALVCSD